MEEIVGHHIENKAIEDDWLLIVFAPMMALYHWKHAKKQDKNGKRNVHTAAY